MPLFNQSALARTHSPRPATIPGDSASGKSGYRFCRQTRVKTKAQHLSGDPVIARPTLIVRAAAIAATGADQPARRAG